MKRIKQKRKSNKKENQTKKKEANLGDQHDGGHEKYGDRIGGLPNGVRVGPEQHDGDEGLAGARLEKRDRVPLDRPLQRFQLITARSFNQRPARIANIIIREEKERQRD